MQVYGDIERIEDAADVVPAISRLLDQYEAASPGLQRHQALVAAFIRAGELAQGIADAEFAQTDSDDISERQEAAANFLLDLARSVAASWDSAFAHSPAPDRTPLHLLSTAGPIRIKQAEGYAFYALYPEAYIAAARRSQLGPDTTVIGIRSIGAGLAALVAAALDAPAAFSLRPTGHPFNRHLAIGDRLAARLGAGTGNYAIVDEGPGLSGSSLNSVADWLVAHGITENRIHFFPSHSGDLGAAARAEHRQRWSRAQKHVVSFEQLILDAPRAEHRLQTWIAVAVGPLGAPLQDLSGGQWRTLRGDAPADPAMEQRKFLATANGKRYLAKFAGLGSIGASRLRLAHTLAAAGFTPQPIALCHGFLISPWIEPEDATHALPPTARVLDYLALRATLPAPRRGATLPDLFAMAAYNFGQHWGEPAAAAVWAALGDPQRFEPVPCCTDNRMHSWEWVRGPEGWFKLDAVEHHAAHDLVGCQDIAWDLAGAAVELNLSDAERDALATALAARLGRPLPRDFVAVHELCYLGFQIGLWTMALARNGEAEHQPIRALLARYGNRARNALEARACAGS